MPNNSIPHLRTSERRDFKRCQQRWQWAWRNGLKPKYEKPGALWFGTGIHLALQERYKYTGTRRGKNVLKVWREFVGDEQAVVYDENFDTNRELYDDAGQLGEIMLGAYLDKYGKDERWYVLSAEQTFEIPIPRPMMSVANVPMIGTNQINSAQTLVYYNGTFDLVALDQESEDESAWVWDHKTARATQTQHLSLDDQAGSYWAIAADVLQAQGLISPGVKLDGILYNFLRKSKTDERPVNAEGLATNKPTKAHYIEAINEYLATVRAEPMAAADAKMTLPKLTEYAEALGVTVYGEVSAMQPTANFLREEVWRTRAERRTQIQKIQAEALQMEAVRAKMLPITKNPVKDCAFDCSFFQMCEMHDAGDDWKEFRDLSFKRVDPYGDHRKSADATQ